MLNKITESLAIKIVTGMHIVLFVVKVIFGFLSGSVAVISDGFHSGVDILTTLIIGFATKVSKKNPDSKYNFGYGKAQAIAAFFVAIMAGVTGFEISKYGFEKLFDPQPLENEIQVIFVMIGAILFSGTISFLMTYIGKKNKNPAMIASGKETVGDIAISFSALAGVVVIYFFDIYWLDPLLAFFIGIMILKIAYEIVMENIDVLMGARATDKQLITIQNTIFEKFKIVKAMHDIYTQKLSENEIYLVVHCEIDEKDAHGMDFKDVHNLEEDIQFTLEDLSFVQQAVIHLDYHNDSKMNRIVNF